MNEQENAKGPPDLSALTPRTEELARYLAVGRCVDGVTHDINNYLGVAMAYAELVELEDGLRDEAKRMLREIVNRLSQVAGMVSDLTTVARRRYSNPSMVVPADIVNSTMQLRDYALKQLRTNVRVDIEPDVTAILGDGPKIQLALIFLLLNAEEALADAPSKELHVRLRDDSDGIRIYVRNSGAALTDEEFEAALQSGYTTRTAANLGLGLPATRSIAQLHGGDLTYTPQDGFCLALKRENDLADL